MKITKNSLRQMIMEELASLSEYGIGLNPDDDKLHGEHNDSEDPHPTPMDFRDTLDKGGRQIPGAAERWFASFGEDEQKKIKADTEARNAAAAASNKYRTSGEKPWRPTDQEPK